MLDYSVETPLDCNTSHGQEIIDQINTNTENIRDLNHVHYVGDWTPTPGDEYPPEIDNGWYQIAGLSAPYEFQGGDLQGTTVDNGDAILYGTVWVIVNGVSKDYVDEQNALQNTVINQKADTTYVDSELQDKADITYVDAEIDTRVDKSGDTMVGILKGLSPNDPDDFATKEYVDIAVSGGGAVASELTTYAPIAPNGYLELNGYYFYQSVFSELYAVIGDRWNTAFGQEEPPAGTFRVPVSQDLLLFELDLNTEIGTYNHNNATIGSPSPIKCIYSGKNMRNKRLINTDMIGSAYFIDGFAAVETFINNNLEANMEQSNFGFEREFINNNFSTYLHNNDGFGEFDKYSNMDLQVNESYNDGFIYS